MESWKPVIGAENHYLVSNFGNVKRISKNKIIKPFSSRGYLMVDMSVNNTKIRKTVHQLVARAFLDGFEYGDIVNHIDGNKLNNKLDNLEKSTYSLNNIHAHQTKLRTPYKKQSKFFGVSTYTKKYKTKTGIKSYTSYRAFVRVNGKKIFIKESTDELIAAKAYDDYLNSINDTLHTRNFP